MAEFGQDRDRPWLWTAPSPLEMGSTRAQTTNANLEISGMGCPGLYCSRKAGSCLAFPYRVRPCVMVRLVVLCWRSKYFSLLPTGHYLVEWCPVQTARDLYACPCKLGGKLLFGCPRCPHFGQFDQDGQKENISAPTMALETHHAIAGSAPVKAPRGAKPDPGALAARPLLSTIS